jgi:hypothetical protein
LKNMSPVPKTPRKYSVEEMATIFYHWRSYFYSGKAKRPTGNKVEEQRNRRRKQPQYFRSTKSANTEKEVVNKNRYS